MKVLHVIPSISERSGGPGQAIIPMCRALRDSGLEVLLATTDADLSGAESLHLQTKTIYKELPVMSFKKQLGRSFKYSRPLSQWLDQNVSRYDLVHIHAVFNHACIAAARAAREQNVPYIVRPLGTLSPWGMSQKPLRKKLFWYGGIKSMVHGAAAIHYTSPAEQQSVEAALGLNHGFVVPLGAELTDIQTAEQLDDDSLTSPIPFQQHPYVLVLSRLLPTKGIDVLLDAFLSLVNQGKLCGWSLVLAGDGPSDYVASLKEAVTKQKATARVWFPGWLSGSVKMSTLQSASLLALPSYHENFGLCVIEALACGLPVLISPHVNLAQEVEAAGAGWIAPVTASSIEKVLLEALGSREELDRRGRAGRELAASFQWPAIAHQLIKLYNDVLDSLAGASR